MRLVKIPYYWLEPVTSFGRRPIAVTHFSSHLSQRANWTIIIARSVRLVLTCSAFKQIQLSIPIKKSQYRRSVLVTQGHYLTLPLVVGFAEYLRGVRDVGDGFVVVQEVSLS